jgi:hypothetical protein
VADGAGEVTTTSRIVVIQSLSGRSAGSAVAITVVASLLSGGAATGDSSIIKRDISVLVSIRHFCLGLAIASHVLAIRNELV